VERADLERLTRQFGDLMRERFQGAPIQSVAVLQYGDDPEIEPGELLARVVIEAGSGEEERKQALDAFHAAHRDAVREMRRDLDKIPEVGLLEFVAGGEPEDGHGPILKMRLGRPPGVLETGGVPLTPVMARLGPEDLETVDALITAGIAANRAEAVRWALARIRERPAYEKLRERAREIDELKAQF
jgi:hypothetical protein